MNKTTRPIEDNEYDAIIETIRDGFAFRGISHKPNPRIAMALQLERNLGLRISDVLRLTLDSFVRVGDKYRINIYEKKTGKYRDYNAEVVRRLLQHSSIVTTQRYIGVDNKEIEDTLLRTVKIC